LPVCGHYRVCAVMNKGASGLGCSFAYAGVQTQCTGTVRIIVPSPNGRRLSFSSA
jgi:hypothetical protein